MYYAHTHICIIVYMSVCAFTSLSIFFPHATLQLNIQLQSDNNCVKISVEHKSVEIYQLLQGLMHSRTLQLESIVHVLYFRRDLYRQLRERDPYLHAHGQTFAGKRKQATDANRSNS